MAKANTILISETIDRVTEQRSSAAVNLEERIRARKARVGVLGLGYVGLPLAVEFARAGFDVTGIDVQQSKVEQFNNGRSYVKDVKDGAQVLRDRGVDVNYQEHAWGNVAKFFDPDGNLCALRDETTFVAQIVAGKLP